MRTAALDLGTNTFRLLIADVEGNDIRTLAKDQIITRLGGGFDPERKLLSEESIARSLEALKRFALAIRKHKPEKVRATATEIVRRAENGNDFLKVARRKFGIKIETIPPEEEAALAFSGISAYLPRDI
jgi:exopolyphosphatase/guanosine-5'-triphosphate,3'-diphosphate pyrophosphatase